MNKLTVFLTIIILFSITPVVLAQDEYTRLSLDLALYSDGTVKVDFLANAGMYKGIEVIEVRGKGSGLVLVERMKLLEPEVKIRWTPIISLRRQLNTE